ncbi:hypothetical protein EZS27_026647 [termite gut metagenome]|uniref:Uncharacterized protein n=1 Tax=termite gut metagenome TaxID=433724 RepID=A0A5J4QPV4_9ZZZZ
METNVVKAKLWEMTVGYLAWDKKPVLSLLNMSLIFWNRDWVLLHSICPLTLPVTGNKCHGWVIKTNFIKGFLSHLPIHCRTNRGIPLSRHGCEIIIYQRKR